MKKVNLVCFFVFLVFFIAGAKAEPIWSNPIDTNFIVSLTEHVCSLDGEFWIFYKDGVQHRESSMDDCYNLDRSSLTCCPMNRLCNLTTGKCEMDVQINLCGDYDNEKSCSAYNFDVGKNSVELIVGEEGFCGSFTKVDEYCWQTIIDCICKWDNKGKKCVSSYDSDRYCIYPPYPVPIPKEKNGSCTFSMNIFNDCNNTGIYVVNTTSRWEGDSSLFGYSDCKDSFFSVPCGSMLKISFFTKWFFIASIVLIFIVYFFIRFFKKKENKKIKGKKKRK